MCNLEIIALYKPEEVTIVPPSCDQGKSDGERQMTMNNDSLFQMTLCTIS